MFGRGRGERTKAAPRSHITFPGADLQRLVRGPRQLIKGNLIEEGILSDELLAPLSSCSVRTHSLLSGGRSEQSRDRKSRDAVSSRDRKSRDAVSSRDRKSRDAVSSRDRKSRDAVSSRDRKSRDAVSSRDRKSRDAVSSRDRKSRDAVSSRDRKSRDAVSSCDRKSRDAVSSRDRKSRDAVSSRDRKSRDAVSSRDRKSRDAVSSRDRKSRDTVSSRDRKSRDAVSSRDRKSRDAVSSRNRKSRDAVSSRDRKSRDAVSSRDRKLTKLLTSLSLFISTTAVLGLETEDKGNGSVCDLHRAQPERSLQQRRSESLDHQPTNHCCQLSPLVKRDFYGAGPECKGGGTGDPEKTHRPAASAGTIPVCDPDISLTWFGLVGGERFSCHAKRGPSKKQEVQFSSRGYELSFRSSSRVFTKLWCPGTTRLGWLLPAAGSSACNIRDDACVCVCVVSILPSPTHSPLHTQTLLTRVCVYVSVCTLSAACCLYRVLHSCFTFPANQSSVMDSRTGAPGLGSRSGHSGFGFPQFPEITPGECRMFNVGTRRSVVRSQRDQSTSSLVNGSFCSTWPSVLSVRGSSERDGGGEGSPERLPLEGGKSRDTAGDIQTKLVASALLNTALRDLRFFRQIICPSGAALAQPYSAAVTTELDNPVPSCSGNGLA
ncbi:hypothetical protein PR048_018859 [Dryococelus australis]|uniref:Uncharacterized protein n=1 Tax=Dryococelus australis TaxID=614101 RepID=A0ABQ9H1V7_9NEOP|nr:hypothetical protein PR048_018859 [Dryococelus australis]